MPAPKLTAKNRAIVERAIKLIRQEPLRFDMDTFGLVIRGEEDKPYFIDQVPACGTVACLAGWISIAADSKARSMNSEESIRAALIGAEGKAATILGLAQDWGSPIDSDLVFMVDNWPQPYKARYLAVAKWAEDGVSLEKHNPKAAARIAISRLRYYLRTGK